MPNRREVLKLGGALFSASVLGQLSLPESAQATEIKVKRTTSARFFEETSFFVRNNKDGEFLSAFEKYGGEKTFGLPISRPFKKDGVYYQVFRNGVLRSQPETQETQLAPIADWLESSEHIPQDIGPLPSLHDGDFLRADYSLKEAHSALLTNPKLEKFFYKNPNPEEIKNFNPFDFYGFPKSYPQRLGNFIVQRFENYVLRLAGIESGTVSAFPLGELVKDSGLIPSEALETETLEAKIFSRGNPENPLVACTFDDAWDWRSVERVLNVCQKKGLKLTLFPTGKMIKPQAELWRRAVAEGHEIGNHTFNHVWLTSLSDQGILDEVDRAWEALSETLGYEYDQKFIRLPGGAGGYYSGDKRVLRTLGQRDLSVIMWSVDSLDGRRSKDSEEPLPTVESVVLSELNWYGRGNGAIILQHFNFDDTYAFENLVSLIERRGLKITTVSEVL